MSVSVGKVAHNGHTTEDVISALLHLSGSQFDSFLSILNQRLFNESNSRVTYIGLPIAPFLFYPRRFFRFFHATLSP